MGCVVNKKLEVYNPVNLYRVTLEDSLERGSENDKVFDDVKSAKSYCRKLINNEDCSTVKLLLLKTLRNEDKSIIYKEELIEKFIKGDK